MLLLSLIGEVWTISKVRQLESRCLKREHWEYRDRALPQSYKLAFTTPLLDLVTTEVFNRQAESRVLMQSCDSTSFCRIEINGHSSLVS